MTFKEMISRISTLKPSITGATTMNRNIEFSKPRVITIKPRQIYSQGPYKYGPATSSNDIIRVKINGYSRIPILNRRIR